MPEKKSINIAAAPSIPINISSLNDANVKPYDSKRLEDHVLFRFQPSHMIKVKKEAYTSDQIKRLEEWWQSIKIDMRDSPFIEDNTGSAVIIWTFCGGDDADPENGVYGDDCE